MYNNILTIVHSKHMEWW